MQNMFAFVWDFDFSQITENFENVVCIGILFFYIIE